MCVFALKQLISLYNSQNSPVFCAFLDASKAFDRVNHQLLFCKLIERGMPMCLVRILVFWYSKQSMMMKWGGDISQPFNVTNGVRQGGVLSPLLFSVYLDDLSLRLHKVKAACFVGNTLVNHLLYADDFYCFSPSIDGLQYLL